MDMLQVIVALLIILMMLPFGGNASERGVSLVFSNPAYAELRTLAQPRSTVFFTSVDQQAMSEAREKILATDLPAGYQVEFHGDKNSGFYKVVSKGHEPGRDDLSCREILSVSGSASLDRIMCFQNRANRWVTIDPKNYVVDPVEQPNPPEGPATTPASSAVVSAVQAGAVR